GSAPEFRARDRLEPERGGNPRVPGDQLRHARRCHRSKAALGTGRRPGSAGSVCLAAAGLGHYMLGDCAGAVRYGRAAVELRPDAVFAQWLLGAALASSGDGDGAVAAITTAISLLGEVDFLHALLAAAHAARGDTARTAELFARLERKAEAEWVPASWVAVAACANKNPDG